MEAFAVTNVPFLGRPRTRAEVRVCSMTQSSLSPPGSPSAAAKRALLSIVADTDLGRRVIGDPSRQNEILEYVQKTEAVNPTGDPLNSADLSGRWRLVYTDSEEILRTNLPISWLRPQGSIFQTIDAPNTKVENEETVVLPPFAVEIPSKVRATFTTKPPTRINVQFQEFQVGPFKFKASEKFKGFLDTTFLDENMRISRGNKKHVFVLVKDSS